MTKEYIQDVDDEEEKQITPPVSTEYDVLVIKDTTSNKCVTFKNVSLSLITGAGVGLGMMPIFNFFLKKSPLFGVDLHGNEIVFAVSTANTFMVYGFSSSNQMYQFLSDNHERLFDISSSKKIGMVAAKIGASFSVVFPIALLWHIELSNQKVAGSEGFDQFMAWASVATLPILTDKILTSCNAVNNVFSGKEITLTSIGSKGFTYGTSLLGTAGRIASYSAVGYQLGTDMGLPANEALVFSIVFAGLVGSSGVTLFEYQKLKSIFTENNGPLTAKKSLIAAISLLEGAWLSFPLTSVGIEVMANLNLTVKIALLAPMFISHTITESQILYNTINKGCDWILDKCCGLTGENSDEAHNINLDS